mmetsp:Transcript_11719/g.24190  ORF Transcript_11719/g.24190 Transcript_11719/m.24190 type:complete len:91 (+) Transcript_11719:760-1032(+)
MYCFILLPPIEVDGDSFITDLFNSSSETVPSPFKSIDRKINSDSLCDKLRLLPLFPRGCPGAPQNFCRIAARKRRRQNVLSLEWWQGGRQ